MVRVLARGLIQTLALHQDNISRFRHDREHLRIRCDGLEVKIGTNVEHAELESRGTG